MGKLSNHRESTLQRRPEARGFRVEQLLQEAADGRLRVPAFQRPLRWKSKDVIDFFDSIRRGFPVGDLLLSRSRAEAGTVSFGPVVIEASEQPSALWVVDGQQRITALVASLLRDEAVPRGDYWAIWYDLEGEEFKLLLKKEAEPAWIPLNVLCDSVKLLKWIRNWPYAEEHEDLVNRALELGKSIREYEVPAYIVEDAGVDVLRLIFTRVNNSGVRMRGSEIFEALYGVEGEKPIHSAVARLCDLGFGQIDHDLFLRCLRVNCGLSVRDPIDSPEKLPPDSIRRTETALRRAIIAIKFAAGIPHWKLLPHRLPLICLTAFYDQFPEEDSRIDRLVAKWIWRGALTGDHAKVTDSRVTRLVKQLRDASTASDAVIALLEHFESVDLDKLENSPLSEIDRTISLGRASGKIFVLGLLAADPRRPSGDSQQLLWEEGVDDAESLDTDTQSLISDADSTNSDTESANSTIDPRRIYWSLTSEGTFGSDAIIKIPHMQKSDIFSADAETLRSFLLSEDAVRYLNDGSIKDFRVCRRQILTDYFKQFVADRLGDRVDVRPAIRSIVDAATE